MKRCIVVTGSNGGIGRALVETFESAGYNVVATDIDTPGDSRSNGTYIQADLSKLVNDESYSNQIIHAIRNALKGGPLVALINNAAVQIMGSSDSLTRKEWRKTLDVNVIAPFLLTQSLLPELEVAEGSVINIGSIHARLTKPNFVAYATSKAALAGMTRALAVDLGSRIRVNAIEPAAVATDMLKAGFEDRPELYQQLKDCHPQKRIGQPEEVSQLALAIIESGAKFLHGACIELSGGIGGRLCDPD
jgi:NAD(P)-dependent dehydrogenase (short-subunit alcohol dehydrogenase family)